MQSPISWVGRTAALVLVAGMRLAGQTRSGADVAVLVSRGEQLAAANQLDEAAALATRALALQPESGRAHYLLGLVRERQRSFDAAIAEYRAALARSPRPAEAHE